jgi:hypothetical protein
VQQHAVNKYLLIGLLGCINDPDVQGIVAQPGGQGRYTIPTVDFTMGGPWLFEIQVQEGSETHKAYFAAAIGEE